VVAADRPALGPLIASGVNSPQVHASARAT
jgi:hypothetical protein